MEENKIFKSAIAPILLMVIGLINFTHHLFLSIALGICTYILAYYIERAFKKEGNDMVTHKWHYKRQSYRLLCHYMSDGYLVLK